MALVKCPNHGMRPPAFEHCSTCPPSRFGLIRNRILDRARVQYQTRQDYQVPGPESTPPPSISKRRTIILAVDDSVDSEFAFDWAMQQMHRAGDVLQLVHCLPRLQPGRLVAVQGTGLLRVPHIDPALIAEKSLADASSNLSRKFEGRLDESGVKACIGAQLCGIAEESQAAAVVVASSSRGGLREALLGSVASYLTHHCVMPVVVLHRPKESSSTTEPQQASAATEESQVTWLLSATSGAPQRPKLMGKGAARHLVVAVDDSEEGEAAVAWVIMNLWRKGDLLHVLHVVPALPPYVGASLAPDGMIYSNLPLLQMQEAQVEEDFWRDLLLKRLEPLFATNNIDYQLDVITDYGSDPLQGVAAAVVATAEQLKAAALVVCGHSKGTLAEWLLGSVSDYAAHHATVPVVVLHGSGFMMSPQRADGC
eukprot:gene10737-10893_t